VKRRKWIVAGLTTLAIGLAAAYGVKRAFLGMCGNTTLRSAPSPDQQKRAYYFLRDCGAMSGFTGYVTVVGEGEEMDSAGSNALVFDAPNGVSWEQVDVTWLGDSELRVSYPAGSEIYRKLDNVDDVKVIFVPR
jgi:hypothetical protein